MQQMSERSVSLSLSLSLFWLTYLVIDVHSDVAINLQGGKSQIICFDSNETAFPGQCVLIDEDECRQISKFKLNYI